jgi:hypothetical protein
VAVFALINEYVSINSVNLSTRVKSATLSVEAAQLDSTTMGDSWNEVTGGLKSGELAIEFLDDFDASNVDATLWPLLGTSVAFEVRPDAGAVSATNPKYTGSIFIAQHALGGSLGDLAALSVSFPTSGVVTRATS